MTFPPFELQDPASEAHYTLHTQVEVLDRHAVNLPERVARLPKELESRESQIPYDYDLSLQDPQDRVIHNNVVELDVSVLSAIQSPPINFLGRRSHGTGRRENENGGEEQYHHSHDEQAALQNSKREEDTGSQQQAPAAVAAACCGGQLALDPPSRLPVPSRISAARRDVVRVEQVDLSISGQKSRNQQQH